MTFFYINLSLHDENHFGYDRASMSLEVSKVLKEYLDEALHTDGKRPLTEPEYKNLCRLSEFIGKCISTEESYNSVEQSGLD